MGLWLLILVIIGWPIGFFCVFWWVLISPFEKCLSFCADITSLLYKGVEFPLQCAVKMTEGPHACVSSEVLFPPCCDQLPRFQDSRPRSSRCVDGVVSSGARYARPWGGLSDGAATD